MESDQIVTEIRTRIGWAIRRVADAVARVTPAEMLEPRFAGGRTLKDILAHLAWWGQWMV